jgi:hypothetical protein
LTGLSGLSFIPKYEKGANLLFKLHEATGKYTKLPEELQQLTPDLLICMSKLCWYISRAIKNAALSTTGLVTNKADLQTLSDRQEQQDMLVAYCESLACNEGRHKVSMGERLARTSECLRQIQMEML